MSQAVLCVTVNPYRLGLDSEPGACRLLFEPSETGFPYCRRTLGRTFASALAKGMHDNVVFGQAILGADPPSNDRISAQGKAQVITGVENRGEALWFIELKKAVRILRFASRQDKERTRLQLPPKKVASTLDPIAEKVPH